MIFKFHRKFIVLNNEIITIFITVIFSTLDAKFNDLISVVGCQYITIFLPYFTVEIM